MLASDISLTEFAANGTDLLISYDIAAETVPAFNVSVYRSEDSVTRDALVGSQEVTLESDRTAGAHTIEIALDFLDVREDYRLIAVADPAGAIAEESEINNELAFAGGVFRTADGIVHLHGTDVADSVRIKVTDPANGSDQAEDSIDIEIGDSMWNFDASTVSEIHLRLHDGDDMLNVQPQFGHNIHAFAGAGNDHVLSGAGSDWLVGGAGDDFIAGRGNRDLIHGDDNWLQGGDDTLLGGADNDTLEGFAGDDKLMGGRGLDIVSGGDGDDIVDGENDDDLVWSGKGRDQIVNPPGRDEPRDARWDDIILVTTPEELIFAEFAAEENLAPDSVSTHDSASLQAPSESSSWESYGYSGTVGPLWMEPDSLRISDYYPEGFGDILSPFDIRREDTAGPVVNFELAYAGNATAADFLYQQMSVSVGEIGGVSIRINDDDILEGTEDFTAWFSSAVVPSDPGAFIIVDYPPTGQPSTDPDGDPFSATAYIVDGELWAYDARGLLGEAEEESGAMYQIGELYPLDVVLLDLPPLNAYSLNFPSELAIWRDSDRTQYVPSGSAITSLNSTFFIEAVAPVTDAVVSLDWFAGSTWQSTQVDRVVVWGGTIVDVDLDVDSNNNGTIDQQDDPIETTPPGKQLFVNGDDDNADGIADRLATPTLGVDNDLVPLQLSDGLPANVDRTQVQLYLSNVDGNTNVRIWENRGGSLVELVEQNGVFASWRSDSYPSTLWIEGIHPGTTTLQLIATEGTFLRVSPDSVVVTVNARPITPAVNIYVDDSIAWEHGPDKGVMRVVRSGGNMSQPLTVQYALLGVGQVDTAIKGTDYTGLPDTIQFAAYQDTVTLNLLPVNDNALEEAEFIAIELTSVSDTSYKIGDYYDAEVRLLDNDGWTVSIWADEPFAAEDGDTATFTIVRSGFDDFTYPLDVTLTLGGTAIPGFDYDLSAVPTTSSVVVVRIPAGQDSIDVDVLPLFDGQSEPLELIEIEISTPAPGAAQYYVDPTSQITIDLGLVAPPNTTPNVNNYRQTFIAASAPIPGDWPIHHIKEQRLEARYAAAGINIHENQYLRALPPKVHYNINDIQNKFWDHHAAIHGSRANAYALVSWDDIQKLEAEIDAKFSQWWIPADTSPANVQKIAAVTAEIGDGRAFNWGTPARVKNTLQKAGVAVGTLGIVAFIGENISLGNNLVNPSPQVKAAFDDVLRQYGIAYRDALFGTLKRGRWTKLHDAVMTYLNVTNAQQDVTSLINAYFIRQNAVLP